MAAVVEAEAPSDARKAASALHDDGYVAIKGVADAEFLVECGDAALAALGECHAAIGDRGEGPLGVGQKHGYREVTQRMVGRYEMRHGVGGGPLARLRETVEASAAGAAAREALGGESVVIGVSVVIADEDCDAQTWHVDGGHVRSDAHEPAHCVNVFVPLVDLRNGGGTEFRPGSHYLSRDLKRMLFLAKIKKTLRPTVVPELSPGDAVVFDYRVLHRGTRNTSGGPRPVFVVTLARPWFRDLVNFPRRRLFPGERLAEDDLPGAAAARP